MDGNVFVGPFEEANSARAAPEAVIVATDATLNLILQMRSQGRRISSVGEVLQQGPQGRARAGQLAGPGVQNQLQTAANTETTEIELTIISRAGPQAPPSKLTAILRRLGNSAVIETKLW